MITIIGLGEIGFESLKEIHKKRKDIFGVDIDDKRIESIKNMGYNAGKDIPESDVYIISVYTTEQVMNVVTKLNYKNNPLVVIEATVMPGTYNKIMEWKAKEQAKFDLVVFPHRYNPNDAEHHIFNLKRVMGGEKDAVERAMKFFGEFMDMSLVHSTTSKIAELCKPLENTYRFMEIAIAEELKMLCEKQGISFDELRKACNTKWNINIKEARDGIGGKCLPKDTNLVDAFFEGNRIVSTSKKIDEEYKKYVAEKK